MRKNRKTKSKSILLLDAGWRKRAIAFGYSLKNIISKEVCQTSSIERISKVRA